MRLLILVLLAAVALTGCASPVHPVPTTVATPGMPNPEEALRQSIQHVDAEMGQLTPTQVTTSVPVMPEDLQRLVTFKWSGPLDQGVAKLAQSVGYTFFVTAPPGAQPLQVAVELTNVPAYEVFKALGEEAGTRAAVELDPLHHQVQVIHHV